MVGTSFELCSFENLVCPINSTCAVHSKFQYLPTISSHFNFKILNNKIIMVRVKRQCPFKKASPRPVKQIKYVEDPMLVDFYADNTNDAILLKKIMEMEKAQHSREHTDRCLAILKAKRLKADQEKKDAAIAAKIAANRRKALGIRWSKVLAEMDTKDLAIFFRGVEDMDTVNWDALTPDVILSCIRKGGMIPRIQRIEQVIEIIAEPIPDTPESPNRSPKPQPEAVTWEIISSSDDDDDNDDIDHARKEASGIDTDHGATKNISGDGKDEEEEDGEEEDGEVGEEEEEVEEEEEEEDEETML